MDIIVEQNYNFEENESCSTDWCCVVDCDFCGIDGGCIIDYN